MDCWDAIDEEAAREGSAIRRAFRSRQNRRTKGVKKESVVENRDILADLLVRKTDAPKQNQRSRV